MQQAFPSLQPFTNPTGNCGDIEEPSVRVPDSERVSYMKRLLKLKDVKMDNVIQLANQQDHQRKRERERERERERKRKKERKKERERERLIINVFSGTTLPM